LAVNVGFIQSSPPRRSAMTDFCRVRGLTLQTEASAKAWGGFPLFLSLPPISFITF
jgi:hypothetical protein